MKDLLFSTNCGESRVRCAGRRMRGYGPWPEVLHVSNDLVKSGLWQRTLCGLQPVVLGDFRLEDAALLGFRLVGFWV